VAQAPEPWLEAASRIVSAVRSTDVAEFELTHGDFRVRLRRRVQATTATADAAPAEPSNRLRVVAPLTGVFYRSASPTAKPYVNEGDWVDAESVIGLIETMKIFNEVTADRAGRIATFLVESGSLVQAGDALVELEPGERAAAAPEESL
jgi:biotin carboxyl carrier protein